ncbi:nuclear transport factor 2 family protein [Kribbella sp. HUAS MG21]|uniref:Nuclear transport factor 2 family protein n=1 Tax=Kribbella sp. HUAS MG21 TaxID=3160966 RepID=A0AAU7T823_9ACTN
MTASSTHAAVLGLGRMGTAVARRLADHGWQVTGWNRSPVSTPQDFTVVTDPLEAVAKADVVLLALYDGTACRDVIARIEPALAARAAVVNISTIAPQDAAELAVNLRSSYVHAPVLGSVPAVERGSLRILAAGQAGPAYEVLAALGEVHHVDDAATAAALKLIANTSLAGAVSALREALQQAAVLGLSRQQALDVLALGQLGGIVGRKRDLLTGATKPAEFTVGALAKDMDLLSAASQHPLRYAAELAESPAGPDADIALAATVPPVDASVLAPLESYIRGHATGDPSHFRAAFLPSAHVEGVRDGVFVSWNLDEYCAKFSGGPAYDEATRRRRIDSVDVHGTVATASMTLWHGADTFKDIFLLVRTGTEWRIANKAYHRS